MQRNKPGLTDLKKLRQQAQPSEPAVSSPKTGRSARKRAPFLPPSSAPVVPAPAEADRQARKGTARAPADTPPAAVAAPPSPPLADAAERLSAADRNLFRHAVRYVEKIKDPGRVLLAPAAVAHASILEERRLRAAGLDGLKPGKPAAARQAPAERKPRQLSDTYAPVTHDQDDSRYLKTGHGTDVLRDLKRGKWPIGASLDLHGSTLEDARERFERFLSSCLTHDVKCVRIVHGKGYGSPNGDAVLKATVRRWLTQIAEVIAYVECAEADGGAGAVQVLLT